MNYIKWGIFACKMTLVLHHFRCKLVVGAHQVGWREAWTSLAAVILPQLHPLRC